jgi:hypothetical protein
MTLTPGRTKWVCRPVGADNEYLYQRYLGIGKEQLSEWKKREIV